MSNLLLQVIKALVSAMSVALTPEVVQGVLDKAFSSVEKLVISTETEWDDVVVLPMIQALRKALDIQSLNSG